MKSDIYTVYRVMNLLMILKKIKKEDAMRYVASSYRLTKEEFQQLIKLAY